MNTVTTSNGAVFEMLIIAQMVKNFSTLNGTGNLISLFTGTLHWILWRDGRIEPTPPYAYR
jgi:hypothetical protein